MGGSFGEVLGPFINSLALAFGLAAFGVLCVTMRLVCRVERGLLWRVSLVLLLTAAVISVLALLSATMPRHWHVRFTDEGAFLMGTASLWVSVKLLTRTSWRRALVCACSTVALALMAVVVVVGASMR